MNAYQLLSTATLALTTAFGAPAANAQLTAGSPCSQTTTVGPDGKTVVTNVGSCSTPSIPVTGAPSATATATATATGTATANSNSSSSSTATNSTNVSTGPVTVTASPTVNVGATTATGGAGGSAISTSSGGSGGAGGSSTSTSTGGSSTSNSGNNTTTVISNTNIPRQAPAITGSSVNGALADCVAQGSFNFGFSVPGGGATVGFTTEASLVKDCPAYRINTMVVAGGLASDNPVLQAAALEKAGVDVAGIPDANINKLAKYAVKPAQVVSTATPTTIVFNTAAPAAVQAPAALPPVLPPCKVVKNGKVVDGEYVNVGGIIACVNGGDSLALTPQLKIN